MGVLKKIWSFLSKLPAFTNLFDNAMKTGRIDPIETLNALSSVSPGTKKIAETALNTALQGGDITDVVNGLSGAGVDLRMLLADLRKSGDVCNWIANIIEGMIKQKPQEVVDFGEHASKVSNWVDLIKGNI